MSSEVFAKEGDECHGNQCESIAYHHGDALRSAFYGVKQIEEAGHFLFVFDVYQRPLEEVPSVSERVLITLTTRALVGAPGELVSGDGRTCL